MMNRPIDHIVYCVPDLEVAVDHIEKLLGVRPVIGGRHLTKGTKNALLNLGKKCYLEILAIDQDNKKFEGVRWMGIDLIQSPKITRWSLKSDQLKKDSEVLSGYSLELGVVDGGSRQTSEGRTLNWQMILPAATPEVELLPFMTDWSKSEMHPTDSLEEGCYLKDVELFHPNPSEVQYILSNLGVDINIIKANEIRIAINIESPNGIQCLF